MSARARRGIRVVLVALGLVLAVAGLAAARPGGGQSYSGGGGHSSGGGGYSGGGGNSSGSGGAALFQLIYWLFQFIFNYPQIGLPIIAIVIAYFVYAAWKQHKNRDWDSGPPVELARTVDANRLKDVDPDFSKSLFEDFAFRLFATAQRLRHSEATLDQIAPYVSAGARAALLARAPTGQPVQAVVVGAMRTHAVSIPDGDDANVLVGIEYEANVTVAAATYFSVERWTFARSKAARTKPPNPARGFPCPNCGAPWSARDTGTQVCASCGQVVDNGRFDWVVTQVSVRSIDQRPPTLTEEVEERGTDLPTYSDAASDERWAELEQADPAVDGDTFHARLTLIYNEMNKAWSANDLAPARGLVTDGLFDYLSYWTTAYQQQRLRNVLADMRIEKTELAKVDKDRWFDAVTVRIWATGKDYVIRVPEGSLVRGSKRTERAYSEYWTLIRSVARKGTPTAEPVCSNCGAPLAVTQSGECSHCNAHVTLGEFDWVLSKIEQDDSYRG